MKLSTGVEIDLPIVAADLRRWRDARRMSLRTFARQLDVTCSYWSKVERGESEPGLRTCLRAMTLLLNHPTPQAAPKEGDAK